MIDPKGSGPRRIPNTAERGIQVPQQWSGFTRVGRGCLAPRGHRRTLGGRRMSCGRGATVSEAVSIFLAAMQDICEIAQLTGKKALTSGKLRRKDRRMAKRGTSQEDAIKTTRPSAT